MHQFQRSEEVGALFKGAGCRTQVAQVVRLFGLQGCTCLTMGASWVQPEGSVARPWRLQANIVTTPLKVGNIETTRRQPHVNTRAG